MRNQVLVIAMFAAFAACGDDGGSGMPDARPMPIDAMPDAPPVNMGLGAICSATQACPAAAPQCLATPGAAVGFCSQVCLASGAGMTGANGNLPLASVTPPPDTAACTAAHTSGVGTAACNLITATTPPDQPLMPNTNYTAIELHCALLCGPGNACPTGLTCQSGACFPP